MKRMLYVGTSGFAYDDWRGNWYPPDLPRNRYFEYYAERFNAVEINSTFYRIYAPSMLDSLVRRGAGRVQFAVKMTDEVTHKSNLTPTVISAYAASIEPARRAGVLLAVLLQFPQRFHFDSDNQNYLDKILTEFHEFPLVLEIRHESWQSPDAWKFIEDHRINLCLMDMPRLKGLPAQSFSQCGNIGYVRFHGRNAKQWWHAEYAGGRYDYFYSREELEEWVEPVQQLQRRAGTAMAFFNNHIQAKAALNAEMFLELNGQPVAKPGYRDLLNGL